MGVVTVFWRIDLFIFTTVESINFIRALERVFPLVANPWGAGGCSDSLYLSIARTLEFSFSFAADEIRGLLYICTFSIYR